MLAYDFSYAKVFIDDLNRTIELKTSPKKVWVAYPPLTYFFSVLAPDLLVGWNFPLSDKANYYLDDSAKKLPVIGGWFSQREPNLEALLLSDPDLALVWDESYTKNKKLQKTMDINHIQVIALKVWDIESYSKLFLKLGEIVQRKKEAEALATYIQKSLKRLELFHIQHKNEKKPLVYYALGKDGLKIDCAHLPFIDESMNLAHAQLLNFCSKTNVSLSISMEELYIKQPDAIFVQDKMLFSKIIKDARWIKLDAIKHHNVFLVPSEPYNWIIYPPSFMRVIASHWISASLYPEYKDLFKKEIYSFFKLFFRKPPSQKLLDELAL